MRSTKRTLLIGLGVALLLRALTFGNGDLSEWLVVALFLSLLLAFIAVSFRAAMATYPAALTGWINPRVRYAALVISLVAFFMGIPLDGTAEVVSSLVFCSGLAAFLVLSIRESLAKKKLRAFAST